MALPSGIQTVTIVGQRVHPDGSVMRGNIRLVPTAGQFVHAETGLIVQGAAVEPVDDNTGDVSITVVASDADGINPTGGTYQLTLTAHDATTVSFPVLLPKGTPVVKLAAIMPVSPTDGEYVVVSGPAGPAGATGPAGAQGPAGATGPQPALGAAGAGDTIALKSTDPTTTNPRTPTGHAASHAAAGSDAITVAQSQVSGLAAALTAWRRRDLPDQALADTLYTGSAPTISTAQTTTPVGGYIKYAPAGVTLAGTDVTGPFTYLGAGGFQIGASAPDTSYALPTSKYPNTYASGQSVWSVEFGTDAQIFQVRMKYISTATMYRLSIDGRKVTDLMQSSGGTTAGSGHLITFDLGSAAPRRIRLDFTTFPFGGVYLPPTATMWQVPAQGGRLMVLGDSLSDGSTQNTGFGAGTWFARAARLMGVTDAWEQARGGTGYITPGSYATLADRLAADVIAWAPDRLVVWAGYNDNGGNQTTLGTAAASLYAAIKSGLPACQVFVIGCWSPTATPATSVSNTDATLRTAAAGAGFPCISPLTGSCYDATGTLVATHGPWINSGNIAAYIGGDSVHPTDAGHVYLSRRIVASLRALMPA